MSTAAHFDIEYLQYLKPDGSLAGPLPPAVPDAASLLPIFKQMLFLRTFDGKVNGARIDGQVSDGHKSEKFSATRKGEGPAIETVD